MQPTETAVEPTVPTKKTTEIVFFSTPPKRLFILVVVTFGLYGLYWFYKNWQAVKTAESSDIWPIARAIFSIFTAHSLFKKILASAEKHGYTQSYNPTGLAAIYVLALLVGNGTSRYDEFNIVVSLVAVASLLMEALPLRRVQEAINYSNEKITGEAIIEPHKNSTGETVIIVIGAIIFGLAMLGYFIPSNT